MRCITLARHLSKNVKALRRKACIWVESCSCDLSLEGEGLIAVCLGSSRLIRSGVGVLVLGADDRLATEGFDSGLLYGSNVAVISVRMASMLKSTRSANSTRSVGVSRTDVSDAPSSLLVLSGALPDIALAKFENMAS